MYTKMSVQLLDKTRKINKLLHNNNSTPFWIFCFFYTFIVLYHDIL